MANIENSYQINYNGVDIQKQLDYVNDIFKSIIKNTDDTIAINQLKTATITTDNLTSIGNIVINGSVLSAKDATAIFKNATLSSIAVSNSSLNDNGLITNTIKVKNDTKETYISPEGVRSESLLLGNTDGSANITYWNEDNLSTGGKTYGLEIASPIIYDKETTPNTLTIKNANSVLVMPNENEPSTTTSYSFGQLVHRLNYVGSLENFLPITVDANTGFSRVNINNIDTITSSAVNASTLSTSNINNNQTITTSIINATEVNASIINMSDNGQAQITTATVNNLTVNGSLNVSRATATFNTIMTSTIRGETAILTDLTSTSMNVEQLVVNKTIASLSVDDLSVNQTISSLSINSLNVDTIKTSASNYISSYLPVDTNINITNDNCNDYNGMLLIADSTADITITFDGALTSDVEIEVLRFNTGNVAFTSSETNIIANAKLTSSATIKKQYEVVGVKNFIHSDGVYWLISGNVSA